MENTFAGAAFKSINSTLALNWKSLENEQGTVFPDEFGLDLNSDFIRSPLQSGQHRSPNDLLYKCDHRNTWRGEGGQEHKHV